MKLTIKDRYNTLRDEQQKVLDGLKDRKPGEEEYESYLDALERLSAIEAKSHGERADRNTNTMLNGVIQLIAILLVLKHEELNVISTKAWGWILRGGR